MITGSHDINNNNNKYDDAMLRNQLKRKILP